MRLHRLNTSHSLGQVITLKAKVGPEIERRWDVKYLPKNHSQYPHDRILQGYLYTRNGRSIRIRKVGDKYYQTVKEGTGIKKDEAEIEIPELMYKMLWKEAKERDLEKTRYRIPYNGFIIELDIYHGKLKGFMTVEVEFNSKEEARKFIPPDWFGVELTGIKEFSNKSLATEGISKKLLERLRKN